MSRERVYNLLQSAIKQFTETTVPSEQKALLKTSILKSIVQIKTSTDILLYKCIQWIGQIGLPIGELQEIMHSINHSELADSLQDAGSIDAFFQKLLLVTLRANTITETVDVSSVLTTENELLLHCKATGSNSINNPNRKIVELFEQTKYNSKQLIDVCIDEIQRCPIDFNIDEIWDIVRQRCMNFHNFHSLVISIHTLDCNYHNSLFIVTMYILYHNAIFSTDATEQETAPVIDDISVSVPLEEEDNSLLEQLQNQTLVDDQDPTDAIHPSVVDGEYPDDYQHADDDMPTQSVSEMLNDAIVAEIEEAEPDHDDQSISVIENSVPPEIRVNKLPLQKTETSVAMDNIKKFVNMNKQRFPEGVPKALMDIKEL